MVYTRIANDMKQDVALGSGAGINKYYCGEYVGREALPGSNGYCGPDDGPQCDSCTRFTACVDPRTAELARLRADNLEYSRIVQRRHTEHGEESAALRKELDMQKKRVSELETELGLKRKKIRELESAAGGSDEWTRECDKVWRDLYKAVAKGFHPDKTGGKPDTEKLEAFFKVVNAKNEAMTGKEPKSAAVREHEEAEAVARMRMEGKAKREREEAEADARMRMERKAKREKRPMTEELLEILGWWKLQSEEGWLLEQGVFCVQDFEYLCEDDIKGRNPALKKLLEKIQGSSV